MKGFVMNSMVGRCAVAAAILSLACVTGCAPQGGDSYSPPPATGAAAPTGAGTAQATETVITIRAFKFEVPASVKPGAMVAVTNGDGAPHTLTAKDKGGFDVEVPAGATVMFQAPDTAGDYAIICKFHPQMTGTLVVK